MVVGAFPVAKLGALILKQISKPLANVVKRRAKTNPLFRTYICMPPAQFYHWAEVKMKMWSMNLGKPVNVPKLNEALAIELGAELLGEGIIFIIAAALLVAEYIRSSRKEEKKEEERLSELSRIQDDLKDLYMETAKQDAQIRELVRILRIKMPEVSYNPTAVNQNQIPEHHRDDYQEEAEPSMFSYVKGWVWNAIDLIIPEESAEELAPQKVIVNVKVPSSSTPTTPSQDNSSGGSNSSVKTPETKKS